VSSLVESSKDSHGVVPTRGRRLYLFIQRLFRDPITGTGTAITLLFLLVAIIGPFIAPYGANEIIPAEARLAPSAEHWFGTDNLGRDVFSRVLLGAREILVLSGFGTILAVLLGTLFGLLTGYQGGWLDEITMRTFDSLLALPALLLALLLLGTVGNSKYSVIIVIVVVYTPIVARVVRSVVLAVKSKSFEILPSVIPTLSVESALRFSYAIFLVASLGFLGVGVQPPSPNWGLMVKEARAYVNTIPWALIFPALAISLVVIGVNLLADGIKRILSEDQTI
jgi:peptide/nickel transport system permease protein